jgi:hypothetical protein
MTPVMALAAATAGLHTTLTAGRPAARARIFSTTVIPMTAHLVRIVAEGP